MLGTKYKKIGILSGVALPLSVICLFAMMAVGMSALGGAALRKTQQNLDDGYDCAVAASYLRTQLLQQGSVSGVSIYNEEGVGQVLVIARPTGNLSYETRIFLWEGYLRETFVVKGTAFEPKLSAQIIRLRACAFAIGQGQLFTAEMKSQYGTAINVAILLEGNVAYAS